VEVWQRIDVDGMLAGYRQFGVSVVEEPATQKTGLDLASRFSTEPCFDLAFRHAVEIVRHGDLI
jgi:hypothetical protein